jgi:ABC-2 type transport system ATP-binding protein
VDNGELDGVLRYLSSLGVRSLTSQPPTLEELFLRHYETQPPVDGSPGGGPTTMSR